MVFTLFHRSTSNYKGAKSKNWDTEGESDSEEKESKAEISRLQPIGQIQLTVFGFVVVLNTVLLR